MRSKEPQYKVTTSGPGSLYGGLTSISSTLGLRVQGNIGTTWGFVGMMETNMETTLECWRI